MERRPTVLLADDDEATREAVGSLLEDEGYSVLFAADGFAVLDMLGRERPDFMLVDLRMPGFDGRELIRALDGSESPPPLIAMTASGPEPHDADIPHPILRKPFGANALLEAIAAVCPPTFDDVEPSTDQVMVPAEVAILAASDTSKHRCGCGLKARRRCDKCGEALCLACATPHVERCNGPGKSR